MSDEEKKLPAGASVEIVLRRRRRDAPERAPAGQEEPPRSIVPTDDEPTRYLRRPAAAAIAFYDLGTRLRSVPAITGRVEERVRLNLSQELATPQEGYQSEYVEILIERPGVLDFTTTFLPATNINLDAADREYFNRMLLGSLAPETPDPNDAADPLDPTGMSRANGSARNLSHAMQSYRSAFSAAQDSVLPPEFYLVRPGEIVGSFNQSSQRIYDRLPAQKITPFPASGGDGWTVRFRHERDAGERWNENNRESGAAFQQINAPAAAFPLGAAGGLLLATFYPSFDADINPHFRIYDFDGVQRWGFNTEDHVLFKVTSEPLYESAEATYNFTGKDNRVYLRPVLHGYLIYREAQATPFVINELHSAWAGRSAAYPGYVVEGGVGRWQTEFQRDAPLAARSQLSNWAARPTDYQLTRCSLFGQVDAGSLIAIIAQGKKRYYVWSKVNEFALF